MDSENEVGKTNKIEHMYQYKVGQHIQGDIIKKIYFYNDELKYIIIKNQADEIRVFGGTQIKSISSLLAECNHLLEFARGERMKETINYEKALAINEALLGHVEESEKILNGTIEKIKKSEIVRKKLFYIGIYLAVTAIMVLLTVILSNSNVLGEKTLHFFKIAMFGSLGGFISLNIRLKKVEFEIAEKTFSYVLVSIYKLAFAMVSSIISYFLIESELIFSALKYGSTNYLYLEYIVATVAGFSESLLPNIFSNFEKEISS